MKRGEADKLLQSVKALQWTEEMRSTHPWYHDTLIRRKDVLEIITKAKVEA